MKPMFYKVLWLLLYSRLLIAILLLISAFTELPPFVIISLCTYVVVTELAGGIIMRRFQLRIHEFRQLEAKTNTIFWFSCLFYLCICRHDFLSKHINALFILVFSELFIILSGFLRFRERVSFKTALSRSWAFVLLWCVIELVSGRSGALSFRIAFWYGIIAQLEILVMVFILKRNETYMRGFIKALRSRREAGPERRHFS